MDSRQHIKVLGQRSPQGGGKSTFAPPSKYRARPFLKAGIDSKTCSVDRKSHSAYVQKKSWPKIRSRKKVRAIFREKKSLPSRNINQTPTKSHWKSLGENPSIWPWSVRGNHQNCSISELRRSWASYRCMNTSEMSCKQRFWCLWILQGGSAIPKVQKYVKQTFVEISDGGF